jgi:DNA-directed RNA polymerase subunit RPC12/RpoP
MNDRVTQCVVCPKLQQADAGLVCFSCSNRILRHLRELEEYLPTLSLLKRVVGESRHSPGFASQSPANDTAVHHTDWRSGWDALDGLGAVATLHSWARAVREDRAFQPPHYVTLTTELEALRANHSWLTHQPFVDEYARELREVHMAVRATAADPVPRSVGKCIHFKNHQECKGSVYELDDASGARCSRCGDVYSGLDLVRFRTAQEAS